MKPEPYPELSRLTNLETLALHNNQLTGTIPPELSQLPSLEHLYLHGNQLTRPPFQAITPNPQKKPTHAEEPHA